MNSFAAQSFRDTTETVHHIDVINQYIQRNYEELGMSTPTYIDSHSELYPQLLDTVNEYAYNNPNNGVTMHGLHYIHKECVDDYLSFALLRVSLVPLAADMEDEEGTRPSNIRESDIYVGSKFLKKNVPYYNRLTRREIMMFDEFKDMYHDQYYGNVRRFNKYHSEYISKNKALKNMFIQDLRKAARDIYEGRFRDTRHMRAVARD